MVTLEMHGDLNYPEERWLPVVGYEGLYEVSDMGRVRSVDRMVAEKNGKLKRLKGKILSQGIGSTGYYLVALCANGTQTTRKVHRIVLEAFVGLKPKGMLCCHGTGGPLDNRLINLSWGTYKKNAASDRLRDGTLGVKLTPKQVEEIARDERTHARIAKNYGVFESTVQKIKKGYTWGCLGLELDIREKQQGENHGSSKLTNEAVLAIREDKRTHSAIAKEHNIARSNVSVIKSRKTWKHLP
jgi:hypothetical protein